MKYKIEITEDSVSIKTQDEVFDKDGNPIGYGKPHRVALGVGNFASDPDKPTRADRARFKAERDKLILAKTGVSLRDL